MHYCREHDLCCRRGRLSTGTIEGAHRVLETGLPCLHRRLRKLTTRQHHGQRRFEAARPVTAYEGIVVAVGRDRRRAFLPLPRPRTNNDKSSHKHKQCVLSFRALGITYTQLSRFSWRTHTRTRAHAHTRTLVHSHTGTLAHSHTQEPPGGDSQHRSRGCCTLRPSHAPTRRGNCHRRHALVLRSWRLLSRYFVPVASRLARTARRHLRPGVGEAYQPALHHSTVIRTSESPSTACASASLPSRLALVHFAPWVPGPSPCRQAQLVASEFSSADVVSRGSDFRIFPPKCDDIRACLNALATRWQVVTRCGV